MANDKYSAAKTYAKIDYILWLMDKLEIWRDNAPEEEVWRLARVANEASSTYTLGAPEFHSVDRPAVS